MNNLFTRKEKTEEDLKNIMDVAIREGRNKLLTFMDSFDNQDKYDDYRDDISAIRTEWRNITLLENYPVIVFPLELPDWFPTDDIKFNSVFNGQEYIDNYLEEQNRVDEEEEMIEDELPPEELTEEIPVDVEFVEKTPEEELLEGTPIVDPVIEETPEQTQSEELGE